MAPHPRGSTFVISSPYQAPINRIDAFRKPWSHLRRLNLKSPMNLRHAFYQETLAHFIRDRDASILVCAGGHLDKEVFQREGFTNVTISNLDVRMQGEEYAPYKWLFADAQALPCDDESYDYVVIHAALHHCSLPHKALTEMYRAARKAILAFEARDSLIMRLIVRLRLTQVFEHTAVYYNDCKFGGVNNTEIPNYVYRWTEREVEKTINAFAPYGQNTFRFRYGTAYPTTPEAEKNASLKVALVRMARPWFWLFARLFPRQQNLFAFYVEKPSLPRDLYPWLAWDSTQGKPVFNREF